MQISFLSFSIFAGFWSLDDKEVITLFGRYIFFHYSIRNGSEALSPYLNHLRNLRKIEKESNNPSVLIKLLSQKKYT